MNRVCCTCCSSRTWALVIGVLQTITGVSGILFAVLHLSIKHDLVHMTSKNKIYANVRKGKIVEESNDFASVGIAFTMISSAIVVISGPILLMGVTLYKPKLIHVWMGVQIIYALFVIGGTVLSVCLRTYMEAAFNGAQIVLIFLCLWMVIIFRRDLSYRDRSTKDEREQLIDNAE